MQQRIAFHLPDVAGEITSLVSSSRVASNLVLQSSVFNDSTAGLSGGAVRVSGSSNVTMMSSTVDSCLAQGPFHHESYPVKHANRVE